METQENIQVKPTQPRPPVFRKKRVEDARIKVCFALNRSLYREFRQACIQLGTTVCHELEVSIRSKLDRWKRPAGTGSRSESEDAENEYGAS